jgi:hypothetical protein
LDQPNARKEEPAPHPPALERSGASWLINWTLP